MKNLKYIYLVVFCIFLHTNLFAATTLGPATEYKITIKKIELCGVGSSIAECVAPIAIFTGDSGLIDIASTTAGATAAGATAAEEQAAGTPAAKAATAG